MTKSEPIKMTVRDFRKNMNSTLLKSGEIVITLYGKGIARVLPFPPIDEFTESTTTETSKKN